MIMLPNQIQISWAIIIENLNLINDKKHVNEITIETFLNQIYLISFRTINLCMQIMLLKFCMSSCDFHSLLI